LPGRCGKPKQSVHAPGCSLKHPGPAITEWPTRRTSGPRLRAASPDWSSGTYRY
jgi:hypothetical protein